MSKTKTTSTIAIDSRRDFLRQASATAATAALLTSLRAAFPSGAFAQATGPEVKGTKLGYIALTDAAPLIIAKEKGIYAKYGLPDMEILKQASWAARRPACRAGSRLHGLASPVST